MRPLVALALAETRMLARNRTAAFNALAMPIIFGGLWLVTDRQEAGLAGPLAALQVTAVLAFTVFSVATTTLVARRQQRVLKRWRSSAASTGAIIAGTLAPLGILLVVQSAVLLTATGIAIGVGPADPVLLAVAVLAGGVLCSALAFVTAAYSHSVETVTITAIPVIAALFGGAVWASSAAPDEVTWQMLATGGGALAQLTRVAWDGLESGYLAAVAPSLAVIAALTAAGLAGAVRVFRWEPRS